MNQPPSMSDENESSFQHPPAQRIAPMGKNAQGVLDPQSIVVMHLASRGARLGGAVVDGLAGFGVIAIVLVLAHPAFDGHAPLQQKIVTFGAVKELFGMPKELFSFLLGSLVFWCLHGVLVFTRGQTIGKMIAGTMVVRKDGSPCSGPNYLGMRWLPIVIASTIPVLSQVVGLVNALLIFRNERNCLHDDIAGTRVVDARSWQRRMTQQQIDH